MPPFSIGAAAEFACGSRAFYTSKYFFKFLLFIKLFKIKGIIFIVKLIKMKKIVVLLILSWFMPNFIFGQIIGTTTLFKMGERRYTGKYFLEFQGNGDLVIYRTDPDKICPIFHTGTNGHGATCYFQEDGNIVIHDAANKLLWASGIEKFNPTGAKVNVFLALNPGGNLVLYKRDPNRGDIAVWSTDLYMNEHPGYRPGPSSCIPIVNEPAPRVCPPGPTTYCKYRLQGGSELSLPTYIVHKDIKTGAVCFIEHLPQPGVLIGGCPIPH